MADLVANTLELELLPKRASMNFSERAWEEIKPIYAAILTHPFIRELAAGTLHKERFQFYMVQDALYLTEFSRALSLVAASAPDPDTMMQFDEYARTALTVERHSMRRSSANSGSPVTWRPVPR